MCVDTIYHYTSVETLAMILASHKLRFNRLDRVDDMREAQKHKGIDFGKYFFASCLLKGVAPSIEYLDIEMSKQAFESLVVTTGPHCSEGAKLCVDSLVKRYAPKGKVVESCLAGAIREP